MLKSSRRFGVEVEFICPTQRSLNQIRNQIHVVDDGSLRPHKFAGEWVTPILQGQSGADEIHHGCSVLKKNRASTEEACTSIHVHLDGRTDTNVQRMTRRPETSEGRVYGISNALYKQLSRDIQEDIMRGNFGFFSPSSVVIDDVRYLSLGPISKHPLANYTYFHVTKPDRFQWLRRVFYFYTKYSPVMEGIVSNSRKFGNMYCIPLGVSYDAELIRNAPDMDTLRMLWYKGNSPNGHYDNSRYHNVNLHSFFSQPGTVEIRSHGGTTDAHKILLWVNLHQTILDKLEDCFEDDIVPKTDDLYREFINFLPDELNKSYVKRLLGYYSNIQIK